MTPIDLPINAVFNAILGLFLILSCSSSQTNVTP
jgi:hypothetical protein